MNLFFHLDILAEKLLIIPLRSIISFSFASINENFWRVTGSNYGLRVWRFEELGSGSRRVGKK